MKTVHHEEVRAGAHEPDPIRLALRELDLGLAAVDRAHEILMRKGRVPHICDTIVQGAATLMVAANMLLRRALAKPAAVAAEEAPRG